MFDCIWGNSAARPKFWVTRTKPMSIHQSEEVHVTLLIPGKSGSSVSSSEAKTNQVGARAGAAK